MEPNTQQKQEKNAKIVYWQFVVYQRKNSIKNRKKKIDNSSSDISLLYNRIKKQKIMGSSNCKGIHCLGKTQTKQLTLGVEEMEPSGQIVESDEQYDNPLHYKLQTNFLQTSVTICKNLKDYSDDVVNEFEGKSFPEQNEKSSEKTIRNENKKEFISSLNFKQLYLYNPLASW